MDLKPRHQALVIACAHVNGQAALARLLGVQPETVNQWVTLKRPIPPERCVAIESATDGAITRRDLRPDDWQRIWPELSQQEQAHA